MATDFWSPAIPVSFLGQTPQAAQILSSHFLIWPQQNGEVRAFRDRCCHRAYPISKGHFKDGLLTCGYHGWRFDQQGKCVHIPSEPNSNPPPAAWGLESVNSMIQDGYVWIWMGEAPPPQIPASGMAAHFGFHQGRSRLNCSALSALENAFDFSHVPFTHNRHPAGHAPHRPGEVHESLVELKTLAAGCSWAFPMELEEPYRYQAEFRLPGSIYLTIPQFNGPTTQMIIHVVELGERECRFEWSLEKTSLPSGTWQAFDGEGEILREDRAVLEAIEKAKLQGPEFQEHSVTADRPALLLREIFQAAKRDEWNPTQHDLRTQQLKIRRPHGS